MIGLTRLTNGKSGLRGMNMKRIKNARVMLIVSMTVFGTLGLFVRHIPLPSGELALYRAILAAVLIGLYLAATKQKIPFGSIKKEIPLLLVSGVAMGINWILLFEAYKYTTVSVATLSYYFAPVIVTVVCPFLFREKLTGKQIICFLMSTLGLVMITGIGEVGKSGTDGIGILFGLGAAVFYATVILLNKFIKNVDGIHRTFLQFLAAILVLIPYVAVTGGMHLDALADWDGAVFWWWAWYIPTLPTACIFLPSKNFRGRKPRSSVTSTRWWRCWYLFCCWESR